MNRSELQRFMRKNISGPGNASAAALTELSHSKII